MELRKRKRQISADLDQGSASQSTANQGAANTFASPFFDAVLESSCDVVGAPHRGMDLDQYEVKRRTLELHYGVEIPQDAVLAASEILNFIYAHNEEPSKVGVAQLLEEAATKLRNDFNCDSGEKDFDLYVFLFDRAFVESREIIKEKDNKISGVPCVKEELEEVKCALEAFRKHWAHPLHPQDHISLTRLSCLQALHKKINLIFLDADAPGKSDLIATAFQDLHCLFADLLNTVDISFRRCRTVTSRIIAEVASSITGVPRCFFPAPYQLPSELLVRRLSQRVVGLDNQLRAIINLMSNKKPGSSSLCSFLLLGLPGQGKTALAEALAKEMFDDRIMEYSVAEFTEKDFVEQVCSCPFSVVDEANGISDSAIQRISSCVVVFDYIDKADPVVYDIILQILDSGSHVDGFGRRITFSNVLILFTSSLNFPYCACPRIVWETSFKPPFKGLLKNVQEMKEPSCDCNFQEYLTEAVKRFKHHHLDDVIVLPSLSLSHYMSLFRIQVRSAASLCEKKIVAYPSAATFRYAWRNYLGMMLKEGGGHVIKRFVEDLVSRLCNVEVESIIYIDQLLGTNELSFRTQKISDMEVVRDLKTFKESLRNSRIFYQFEKEQAKQIYKLNTCYYDLVELLDSKDEANLPCILRSARELLDMVDCLLARPCDICLREQEQPECFNPRLDIVHESGQSDRFMFEAGFSKMRSKLVEQVPPVQVIAKALFKSIDACHGHSMDEPCQQATSFLVLGLGSMGRCLVDSLSKYFVTDNGTALLVEVDLSTCSNPNTIFRNEPGLLLKKAIMMRPTSVIVFSNLELAPISAFTSIMSILDDGLLFGDDATVLDFRKSVIVFVTDLGKKDIIAKLVGGGPYAPANWEETPVQGPIGIRFEIINRVDEIMLFNPFASEQLLRGARLPMKEGWHLTLNSPGIIDVLVYLFNGLEEVDELANYYILYPRCSRSKAKELDMIRACVRPLRKGLITFDGTGYSRSCFSTA